MARLGMEVFTTSMSFEINRRGEIAFSACLFNVITALMFQPCPQNPPRISLLRVNLE
jgi:hypothetical protein